MSVSDAGSDAARVWDLPTRLFHWLLAICVVGAVVTVKIGGNAMALHYRFGHVVFMLLAFRLVWGFVGGRWSRFSSFVHGPRAIFSYLRGDHREADMFEVGHSPLGALSVFALLAVLAVQVATGLVSFDDIEQIGGPLNRFVAEATAGKALGWHKSWGQWLIYGLVGLHLVAVFWYLFGAKRNLISPMLHGDKALPAHVPPSRDTWRTRLFALAIALVCMTIVWRVSELGA